MARIHELEGYYRSPTIHGERIVFVCETDLWTVDAEGGRARRLSVDEVGVHSPSLSPDGAWLAFVGRSEGASEVYVMPAGGGRARRLTYQGAACLVIGWSRDGAAVRYASDAEQPTRQGLRCWSVPREGGPPTLLPYGPIDRLAEGPGGALVVGRNVGDPARWKRYRGGRTGELWIDPDGGGTFRRLVELPGNLADPHWIGERVFFLSDHEGHGNVYSCDPDGEDLRRHTHHERYYARNASSDGARIVYQCGAELHLLDPGTDAGPRRLTIEVASSKPQLRRRFVSAAEYLEDYDLHPRGHALALDARGKAFAMGSWERGVHQVGERDGVRYRLTRWLAVAGDAKEDEEKKKDKKKKKKKEEGTAKVAKGAKKKEKDGKKKKKKKKKDGKKAKEKKAELDRLITISDAPGEEVLEVHTVANLVGDPVPLGEVPPVDRLEGLDIGRPIELLPAPKGDRVALTNQRFELILVDLKDRSLRVVDTSRYGRILGMAWSPDGKWLAYGFLGTSRTSHLRVVEAETGEVHPVTEPVHADVSPSWDPRGKHLFFIGYRTFDPVYDRMFFDLGFPRGGRPYALTLEADQASPLDRRPRPLEGGDDADEGEVEVAIDFDGIAGRLVELPVAEGIYGHLEAIAGKLLYTRWPVQGALGQSWSDEEDARGELLCFDLTTGKEESYATGVAGFTVGPDRKTLAYHGAHKLRVVKAGACPEGDDTAPGRKSGWVDLSRPRLSVVPAAEWRQMYREAWRLQRDNFWNPTMAEIDWPEVYERYLPVLERVATRAEFSDLMWEVQGELGTSHAYEFGGDYPRRPPAYGPGFLGADLRRTDDGWVVARRIPGDPWNASRTSPLLASGLDVRDGDRIVAIDGVPLTPDRAPGELLVNRAGTDVALTVAREGEPTRSLTVRALGGEAGLRYRDWVEAKRAWVHQRSDGKLGYVHVPNMGAEGYAEFHRYYQAEIDRTGLVIDVRYNGGGHVSQLLLEKLARRRIGYDVPRYGQPMPYPEDSVLGPLVCLTNEHAGSDGDIFSHCFKLLKLGPLVGKRTWGGVVGIWPRHPLVDATITTQAEFAFWFEDVGFGVENYGTEPDVDVDIAPHDWSAGQDPQLEAAVGLALKAIEETQPTLPDFGPRPTLAPPRLPHG